jgi:hypothetical protein
MNFSKENLANEHYMWIEESNKDLFSGTPSRRLFNKLNGDQVLFIINSYGSSSDQFTIEDGRKIEEMISKELPSETKSELSVLQWLKEALR